MRETTTQPAITASPAGARAEDAPATTIGAVDGRPLAGGPLAGGPDRLPPTGDVLAVDVGGTRLTAGIVDMTGRVLRTASRPTPRGNAGAEAVWFALAEAVAELGTAGVVAVGIGSSGPIDAGAGTVSPLTIPAWRRFPLRDRLGELVPGRAVVLTRDALAAAMAEYVHGAGRGARGLLGIVVGTGVGGGLVLDGRVHGGPTGNAGYVGHVVIDFAGAACSCGSRGCVETIASGPAMVRWALDNGWSCDLPDGSALALAARAGHPVAVAAYARGARALAAAIASTVALCEVDRVVIGGGVAKSWGVLAPPLRKALRAYAGLGFVQRAEVVPASLGAAAPLIGAATLARHVASIDA